MMQVLRRWLAVGLCVMLAACATPQRIAGDSAGKVFERTGRFALSVEHAGGKQEAVQGGFAWRDNGQQLQLDLANPLGSTLARVMVKADQAVLTRADGSQQAAAHPDELIAQVLGSPIPVAGLRDWLQGHTGTEPIAQLQTDDQGRVVSFSQDGWRVKLSRYDDLGPRLLQLHRNDMARVISVRLVADSH